MQNVTQRKNILQSQAQRKIIPCECTGLQRNFVPTPNHSTPSPLPPKKPILKIHSKLFTLAQGDLGTNCIFSEVYAGRGKRKDFWASITRNGGVFALLQMIVSSLSLRLKKGETHLLR